MDPRKALRILEVVRPDSRDQSDPELAEAVAAVLSHYAGYIRSCAKMDG